jgi:sulfur carrier protein
MTIVVNGRSAEMDAAVTLAAALARLGYDAGGAGIAVAVNGEVVPRGSWPDTTLAEADHVEVLGATQGG